MPGACLVHAWYMPSACVYFLPSRYLVVVLEITNYRKSQAPRHDAPGIAFSFGLCLYMRITLSLDSNSNSNNNITPAKPLSGRTHATCDFIHVCMARYLENLTPQGVQKDLGDRHMPFPRVWSGSFFHGCYQSAQHWNLVSDTMYRASWPRSVSETFFFFLFSFVFLSFFCCLLPPFFFFRSVLFFMSVHKISTQQNRRPRPNGGKVGQVGP